MPSLGECLRRIALAAAMVDEIFKTTQNTNKTHLLASNYGTFCTLAQRRHIVTLVDRAMQYGDSINHAVDNLQISTQSVRRWRAGLQDTTNPQGCDLNKNHAGPAGFIDDIKEALIAFVTDWRDCGMPVSPFAPVCKIGSLKPEFLRSPLMRI
jgi:hypothetical protein